ncbi:MAG: DUF3969 family protein [Planctomycetaceae bacterium]
MIEDETNRLQRLLALLILGVSDALNDEIITIDEAERLLYSPNTMRFCEEISASLDLTNAIHAGAELGSIKQLLASEEWDKSIDAIRTNARTLIASTPPSDSQLDPWLPRLLKRRS